jgi:hypothetical protein
MKNKLKKYGRIIQVKSNDAEYKVHIFFSWEMSLSESLDNFEKCEKKW